MAIHPAVAACGPSRNRTAAQPSHLSARRQLAGAEYGTSACDDMARHGGRERRRHECRSHTDYKGPPRTRHHCRKAPGPSVISRRRLRHGDNTARRALRNRSSQCCFGQMREPPSASSGRFTVPLRTSTSTDAALLLPGEAGGPPTSSRVAGVSSESGCEARPPVLVRSGHAFGGAAGSRSHRQSRRLLCARREG